MRTFTNPERVTQLLASYGSNSERWPENERKAALDLIRDSSSLKAQWLQAQQLDLAMGILPAQSQTPSSCDTLHSELLSRIVANLPQQDAPRRQTDSASEHNVAKFSTDRKPWLNRLAFKGMLAASLALIVTAVITFNQETPTRNNPDAMAQNALDQWFWEEITIDANQPAANTIDLMAMIEFEQLEDFQ